MRLNTSPAGINGLRTDRTTAGGWRTVAGFRDSLDRLMGGVRLDRALPGVPVGAGHGVAWRAIRVAAFAAAISAVCSLAFFLGTGEARAERPSGPQLLPENTLALLRVPDSREFVAKFREGSMGRMLEDEQVKPLATQLYGTVANAFGQVQDQVGLSLDKILAIPQGELCIAVVAPPAGVPAIVVLLEAGDQIASVQQLVDRGAQEMERLGSTKTTEAQGDALLNIWSPVGNQPGVAYAFKDGVLLFASNTDVARNALAVWNGKPPADWTSLADNRKFTAIMSRCSGARDERPQFAWYVDPIELARVAARGNFAAQTGLAILPAIGLDGLQGIGGSLIFGAGEFDMIQHIHVLLDNPRGGVLKALTLSGGDSTPEPWVPNDVASYMTLHWDFETSYREVKQLVDSFRTEGTTADLMKRRVGEPLGVDFETELLAAMEGRVTYLTWVEKPARINGQTQLVAIKLKDAAAFRETLDKITNKYADRFESDTFGGQRFQRIKVPEGAGRPGRGPNRFGPRGGENGAENGGENGGDNARDNAREERGQRVQLQLRVPEPCVAILGDYLVLTDSAPLLKQCVVAESDSEKSLAAALDFKLIASKVSRQSGGVKPGMMTFNRPEEGMRMLYDLAQGDDVRQMLGRQAANNDFFRSVEQAMKDNPLPPFAVLARYLAPAGGMMTSDETGFHYTSFGLKRN